MYHAFACLYAGNFAEFWEEYSKNAEKIKANGFVDRMRNTLANIVKITFKTISCEDLKKYLNITQHSELEKFANSSSAVEKVESDTVIMTSCPDNQPRETIVAESLRFDEALRLVDSLHVFKQ